MRTMAGFGTFWIALYLPLSIQAASPKSAFPSDAEIRALLLDRIDVQHKSVGMVVGIVSREGRRFIAYGRVKDGHPQSPAGDTVFEIGSVTKVFTALALADMSQRGELKPDDPAAKYLLGVVLPDRNGREITLADLATQTSGLSFFPTGFPVKAPAEYAMYSVQAMQHSLSSLSLTHDPGTHWEYSNLGYGLLGQALANKAGLSYAELIRERVTQPLGMTSTGIALDQGMERRFAQGHGAA